jgi:hypothetical protein
MSQDHLWSLFFSCKGFISARLELDEYSGFEQSFSTREHTKKNLNTLEGAVRDKETRPRLKRKRLKNKGKIGNLALGEDMEFIQVTLMASQTIVGRVNGRVFAVKTIRYWMNDAKLGYSPELVELNRNWYAFTFQNNEHSKWVLSKSWSVNNSPMILKPWNPLFDTST